jgi:hypothetical protein
LGMLSFLMKALPISTRPIRTGSRTPRCRAPGFAPALAAIALLLQIALPGSHGLEPQDPANGAGDFSAAFDEHALCRAQSSGDDTERPEDQAPTADHHGFAACCFWHSATALVSAPAATPEPVAYVESTIFGAPAPQFFSRRLTGTLGARAPPARA